MGRVNKPLLSEEQRKELETNLKSSNNHAFRMRCQSILLKADGRKSKDVGQIVGMCHVSVNSWLGRYKTEGINGLVTKPGRGRKPSINKSEDESAIIAAVQANRQRISLAKAQWESQRSEGRQPVGKEAFRNFLKVLLGRHSAADINALESE
ncbi:MAG: helix-turn-helix domain-containing protein [Bacteroidetes bacterium]|nr:helix-turn-helix domain-containing protein [Bacteroidota bacterium]MCA0231073.1 helix-turn-helix domain-containing protein [Bacteroidota bacterium]